MRSICAFTLALLVALPALAGNDKQPPGKRDDNFGEVTSRSIAEGFDQGGHASDPSGDGPAGSDQPRDGLANAGGERGNLSATMDALGF